MPIRGKVALQLERQRERGPARPQQRMPTPSELEVVGTPPPKPIVEQERDDLAQALYNVWMHEGQPVEGLTADAIRFALEHSSKLRGYEQLETAFRTAEKGGEDEQGGDK